MRAFCTRSQPWRIWDRSHHCLLLLASLSKSKESALKFCLETSDEEFIGFELERTSEISISSPTQGKYSLSRSLLATQPCLGVPVSPGSTLSWVSAVLCSPGHWEDFFHPYNSILFVPGFLSEL